MEDKILKIEPTGIFTNYIYKTIPLAFDESMSYYETLCGLLAKLKNVEVVVNNNADVIKELEDFVNNYFTNLNVQNEINNKLDQMVEDGTLTKIINEDLFNELNDKIENKASSKEIENFYLGAFHKKYSEDDKAIYLFKSNDGYNFSIINNIELKGSNNAGSDPSILYDEDSGYFLIAYSNQINGDFSIYRSKDLINYENFDITLQLPEKFKDGKNRYSPDLFRDKDNNIYVILGVNKTNYELDFNLIIAKLNNIETLEFDKAYEININTESTLYDGSIIYYNNIYYLACTNGKTTTIELYNSLDLINFSQINTNLFNIDNPEFADNPMEGSNFLITDDNKVLVYTELHDNNKIMCGILSKDFSKLEYQFMIDSLFNYKHGSVININTPKSKEIVNNISGNIINYNHKLSYYNSLGLINLTEDTVIDNLTLIPEQVYIIKGNYNLTINNIKDPFNCRKLRLISEGISNKLTINGYDGDDGFKYECNFNKLSLKKMVELDFDYNISSNNYSSYEDITDEVTFNENFLNAFNIIEKKIINKNNTIYYNFTLQAKADTYEGNAITLTDTALIGSCSFNKTPNLANELYFELSNGSNNIIANYKGTNGYYIRISGNFLI